MDSIKIIHISDLHISEHLLRDPESHFKLPHRFGHNVQVFLALDSFLNSNDWDVLVITGDVSRIGNSESFEIARNWINNKINVEDIEVGLDIANSDSRHCIVIPGNHDRFDGEITQGELTNYHKEFDEIQRDQTITKIINGISVKFHLFDSTWEEGGFGFGMIKPTDLVVKKINAAEYNVALLHHHFIQPPKHKREAATELINSADVASYMLNSGFDCVMFGHTHQGYIGNPSVRALSGILNDKKTFSRFWRRITPKVLLRKLDNDCLVSYKRESTKLGQLPTLNSYFNYLYLRKSKVAVLPPSDFKSAKEFHEHIEQATKDSSFTKIIDELKDKKVLVSLAPSACQAEVKWKGFHSIEIYDDHSVEFDRYQYDGSKFVRKDRKEHLS